MSGKLPIAVAGSWALGAAGLGITTFAKVFALAFFVDIGGVPPAIAATLVALATIYDAILDPLIGALSDRTQTRWGRRIPYLAIGSATLCVALAGLFNIPSSLTGAAKIGYISAALILYSTAFGMFNVSYNAIGADLTGDYNERSRLMSLRTAFYVIGYTSAAYFSPALATEVGYGRMGLMMGASVLAIGVCTLTGIRNTQMLDAEIPPARLVAEFGAVWRNRPFLVLISAYFAVMMASAMGNSAALFYVRQVLHGGDRWLGIFAIICNIALLCSLPLWIAASRRLGKKACFIAGAAILSASTASWYGARIDEATLVFAARTVVIGIGSAAVLTMSAAMLPDVIDYDRARTGIERAGIYAGIYTTIEKATIAIGVAFTGWVMSFTGYHASTLGAHQPQSQEALAGIILCFSVLPSIGMAIGAVILTRYNCVECNFTGSKPAGMRHA